MHNFHKGVKIILELTAVNARLKTTLVFPMLTHFVLSYYFIFSIYLLYIIYLMVSDEHPEVFLVLYLVGGVTLEIPLLNWIFTGLNFLGKVI